MVTREEDERFMRRAIDLARLSEGLTRPNPPVGAVLVKDGRVIGEGRHLQAGKEHAETNAFLSCEESPKGATLYVTLEPCSTAGRQPPCTDCILREQVARVVVAVLDANPKHAGRAFALLRQHGVEVQENMCTEEANELIVPFNKHITTGLPFLRLKLAMTLDGRIADRDRNSQWITGKESRSAVQELRRRSDAVLVGAGTVIRDNPSLLYRCEFPDEPRAGSMLLRVVIDTRGTIPLSSQIFNDAATGRTILACLNETPIPNGLPSRVRVWRFAPHEEGVFPYAELIRRLGEEGCLAVLCEGGGHLAGALQDNGLIDEYDLFYAPAILGDTRAMNGVEGTGVRMNELRRMQIREIRRYGSDCFLRIR